MEENVNFPCLFQFKDRREKEVREGERREVCRHNIPYLDIFFGMPKRKTRTIHKLLGFQSQLRAISNMLAQFIARANMFELWKV